MSNPFVLAVMRAMRGNLPKPSAAEMPRAPEKTPPVSNARSENSDTHPSTDKSEAQD